MSQISVIVICKNAASTIDRALDSVMMQSHKPLEVLAVVAPSSDRTMEILQSRRDVVVLEQLGHGIGDARNFGIASAHGRYIAFLDADDEWLPNTLQLQLDAIITDPTAMFAMGCLVKVGHDIELPSEPMPAVTPGGCLFRAEVFSIMGGFTTDVAIAADHEWFMRARLNGINYVSHEDVTLTKHIHGHNESLIRREQYRMEIISLLRGRK